MDINTTLLREKFVIRDVDTPDTMPLTAVSNRLVLPIYGQRGELVDTLVIRAQHMFHCIRMAAFVLDDFLKNGPLFSRTAPFDFVQVWSKAYSNHDATHHIPKWIAVYHKGDMIFAAEPHHPFLDVIEKCDSKNPGNYDNAIQIAEGTFIKMGRKVAIQYEANIGMVMHVKPDMGRCGMIHRGQERNATFNFIAEPREEKIVSPVHCLHMCAAHLEGLQLAYTVGSINDKMHLGLVQPYSEDDKKAKSGTKRVVELEEELEMFENRLKIKFRPEKPDFHVAIHDAEKFHRRSHEARLARLN